MLHMTEEQVAEHKARVARTSAARLTAARHADETGQTTPPQALPVARGELREPKMNKTEAEYAGLLNARMRDGSVVWWKYEGITLKLADDTRYTPDFAVLLADGTMEIHETKGAYVREDGWVKFKLAAALYPFRFRFCQKAAKKDGGKWSIKEFPRQ
jgi:hypothetical protein